MNSVKPLLPTISDADRTPLVDALLELLQWQSDRIEKLEDDIHRLNKQTRKPKFKSSKMDQQTEPEEGSGNEKKKGPNAVKPRT
jgi:transposase